MQIVLQVSKMHKFWSDIAAHIAPYTAGEQPGDLRYIQLNTNENPYPPSKKVAEILRAFDVNLLKLYPDPEAFALRQAIAETKGLSPQNIFVGNGSDEVLAHCFKAFFNQDSLPVVFPDITYSFYPVFCDALTIRYKTIPLRKDFEMVSDDYKGLTDCRGIVFANPNAPTSLVMKKREVREIIEANRDKIVIVDEAYADFSNESVIGDVRNYDNLVVVQTFSKSYSLAGIRCGYAAACPELIQALTKVKDSFNSYAVGTITQNVCAVAVRDTDYYKGTINALVDTRDRFTDDLQKLGFRVLRSGSNFLFVSSPQISAERLYRKLKENGILVRYFAKPKIDTFLRITVGTPKQMQALSGCLKNILETGV